MSRDFHKYQAKSSSGVRTTALSCLGLGAFAPSLASHLRLRVPTRHVHQPRGFSHPPGAAQEDKEVIGGGQGGTHPQGVCQVGLLVTPVGSPLLSQPGS